ncbi:carboxypeptidase-like regulatory domain-containing protein [Sphingobacterium siyangense]|jgi:iron complex outermembrane receptor protein|uniref:carboxypeptidase-like regulatory domain-containing protein n=1 Tax=Sphingobacterium siyangense TaxID=459529 RepID=UPI003DA24B0A
MSKALVISTAICASLFTLNAHAQARKVQGTVVGTDQKGLVGVSVTVPGTRIVAVTDKSGKFSIEIAGNNQELQFTYVGFQTKKVTVLENRRHLTLFWKNSLMHWKR